MSPLSYYRRLLGLAGPAYVLISFFGRLPLAMSQLGTLLLVSTTTGEYAAGGLAAGALVVANAVGAPFAGALADRVGQRPVVGVQSVVGAAGLLAIVLLSAADAGRGWLIITAAAAGAAMPQVGPLARVRWRPITRRTGDSQPRLVDAAFAYEGAADEASFVLGPAAVGVVAVLASPGAAIVAAAVVLAVFGTWFAMHPTAALVPRAARTRTGAPLLTAAFVALVIAQVLMGVVFGSSQTGTTVLATAEGRPGVAGLVHATLGVGSVLAGLAIAGLPVRVPLERRLLVAAAALAVMSTPLLLVGSIGALVPVVAVLGFAVAPYMITVFTLGERVVPATRVSTALTLLAGATGIGYAVGAAVAGRLADEGGHTPAFAVTVSAAVLALCLAATAQRRLRRVQVSVGATGARPAVPLDA